MVQTQGAAVSLFRGSESLAMTSKAASMTGSSPFRKSARVSSVTGTRTSGITPVASRLGTSESKNVVRAAVYWNVRPSGSVTRSTKPPAPSEGY